MITDLNGTCRAYCDHCPAMSKVFLDRASLDLWLHDFRWAVQGKLCLCTSCQSGAAHAIETAMRPKKGVETR